MVILTLIARIGDGLPLAASVLEDEQAGRNLQQYQNQAKQLFKKLNVNSPPRHSLESGPYIFHYLIDRNVCYLALCERVFSVKLAYAYLEDLKTEFVHQYGQKLDSVTRPYPFIEFDVYIQKAKKNYSDSRARTKLDEIHTELRDIQSITVQNIEDVLQRGEALSVLDTKASNLSALSQKYRKDAHKLNLRSSLTKIAAVVIVIVLILLLLYYLIF